MIIIPKMQIKVFAWLVGLLHFHHANDPVEVKTVAGLFSSAPLNHKEEVDSNEIF